MRKYIYILSKYTIVTILSILFTTIIIFLTLETYPSTIPYLNLQKIKYYAIINRYHPDPELVVVYRYPDRVYNEWMIGDLYHPILENYSIRESKVKYVASYKDGFRTSIFPRKINYKIIVIGDSYVEFGEDDTVTLTAFMESMSNIPILNLGRGWYGPHQYIELLKRRGVHAKPEYAILAYFDGNDIRDIAQYINWLENGRYYFFYDYIKTPIIKRYSYAIKDSYDVISKVYRTRFKYKKQKIDTDTIDDLGKVTIGSENVSMMFAYWSEEMTVDHLLRSHLWLTLDSILIEFRDICRDNNIIPIILIIPTKAQIYSEYYTNDSSTRFISKVKQHAKYLNNSNQAINLLANKNNIKVIDLLPVFQEMASQGELLYYRFDTHWNKKGREEAARIITNYLCKVDNLKCI